MKEIEIILCSEENRKILRLITIYQVIKDDRDKYDLDRWTEISRKDSFTIVITQFVKRSKKITRSEIKKIFESYSDWNSLSNRMSIVVANNSYYEDIIESQNKILQKFSIPAGVIKFPNPPQPDQDETSIELHRVAKFITIEYGRND